MGHVLKQKLLQRGQCQGPGPRRQHGGRRRQRLLHENRQRVNLPRVVRPRRLEAALVHEELEGREPRQVLERGDARRRGLLPRAREEEGDAGA